MRGNNLTLSGRDTLFGVDDVMTRLFDTPTCLSGNTLILMADGRTIPLADVRAGTAIYGSLRDHGDRRYALTTVVAHRCTVKPAHRVTLEDGTELVTSSDHRFLTDLGWKHVTGAGCRPFLEIGDEMVGTGRFAVPPEDSTDYRRGYLSGIVRGATGLGLVDREALRRVGRYFTDAGAPIRELAVQPPGGHRRTRSALRHQVQAGFEAITEVLSRPGCPSADWSKGFLAGIFDGEGGGSDGILRLADTDSETIRSVLSGLRRCGFSCTIEDSGQPDGLRRIRLLGGISEQLRFFHAVDPAITRKRSITGMTIDNSRRVVSVEDLAAQLPMYDITTGTGDFIANGMVSHSYSTRASAVPALC